MSYQIEYAVEIQAAKIHPNPWNVNQMSDRQKEAIAESLGIYGQVLGLVVRPHPFKKGEYQIIDGEHRFNHLSDTIRANVIHNLPDAEAKRLSIVLNETRGEPDPIDLSRLLAEIHEDLQEDTGLALPYSESQLLEMLSLAKAEFEEPPEQDEAPEYPAELEGDRWEMITIKLPQSALDVLQQARDLVSEQRDLHSQPAIAWGQVIECLAAEFLAMPN